MRSRSPSLRAPLLALLLALPALALRAAPPSATPSVTPSPQCTLVLTDFANDSLVNYWGGQFAGQASQGGSSPSWAAVSLQPDGVVSAYALAVSGLAGVNPSYAYATCSLLSPTAAVDLSNVMAVRFILYGQGTIMRFRMVQANVADNNQPYFDLTPPPQPAWATYTVSLSSLNAGSQPLDLTQALGFQWGFGATLGSMSFQISQVSLVYASCSSSTPTPSATAEPSGALSATPSLSGSPSATPTATLSPTEQDSATCSPTPTASASGTCTSTASPTASISPSSTMTATGTPSSSATASPSSSLTPSATPTASPSLTSSVTPTASPSFSCTQSPSATPTASPTGTSSATATATPSFSSSQTPTATPSASPTPTASPTPSASATVTPTFSATASSTQSPTASRSPSNSPTPSISPTGTPRPLGLVVGPNPFSPYLPPRGVSFRFPARGAGELCILDLERRVRRRLYWSDADSAIWDGRDDAGHLLGGGVYVYVARARGSTWHGTVTLVR